MSSAESTSQTKPEPAYILPKIKPLHIGDVVVDPPILQAPMAGFTNYAFRQVVREYVGNGDLDSAEKVVDAFRRYDVDGVMIARACLGRPWLFAQASAAIKGEPVPPDPTLTQQKECLLHHYDLVVDRFGERKGSQLMRRYAQGRPGARHFRTNVAKVRDASEFHRIVKEYFPTDKEVATA